MSAAFAGFNDFILRNVKNRIKYHLEDFAHSKNLPLNNSLDIIINNNKIHKFAFVL